MISEEVLKHWVSNTYKFDDPCFYEVQEMAQEILDLREANEKLVNDYKGLEICYQTAWQLLLKTDVGGSNPLEGDGR